MVQGERFEQACMVAVKMQEYIYRLDVCMCSRMAGSNKYSPHYKADGCAGDLHLMAALMDHKSLKVFREQASKVDTRQ